MDIKTITETKTTISKITGSEEHEADMIASGGSGIMIIGVGEGGYKMATFIRRHAEAKYLTNAKYLFANRKYPETSYVVDVYGDFMINLSHIDLQNDIRADFFKEIREVIIVAGMGGKTAAEWTSIIGDYVKSRGVKTVIAVVSTPFEAEGTISMSRANEGIAKIKKSAIDTVITVNYETLVDRHKELSFFNMFYYADNEILTVVEDITGVAGITRK